ncbi:MAG: hypothetical protein JWP05_1824 [Microbacteriaceae bacterium]|jgi:hypothetical protein|nr:hypothetical protein [Microbacteriaceae bacterium]MDQ1577564.1 hypothetical protein [Microbacteriaceae bacterium]
MNATTHDTVHNTVTTAPGRHDHPPQPIQPSQPIRRVNLLDRAALHLGVALIKWGRRPRRTDSRASLAHHAEQHCARLDRERAAERMRHLNVPPR